MHSDGSFMFRLSEISSCLRPIFYLFLLFIIGIGPIDFQMLIL